MIYQALYRKYRPKTFLDVKGQEPIVKTLKGQIIGGRISHAYLFCGTRGTGKTSVAKIFAKAVNCQSPIDGSPCGECKSCKNVQNNLDMNIVEIDAASNNGVDNIRDIRDEVRYTPVDGNYKVYVIDEVHMLSTGAFNALLKTLEEPPKHVIFILATTDPQKIPPTVLSRCQRFDFKRITQKILTEGLLEIARAEGILANENALSYIAQIADGAFRDAESILDQCISFYAGEEITLEKVLDVVGAVDTTVYFRLSTAISDFDTEKCISIVDNVLAAGKDIHQFVLNLIGHLRNLLLVSISEGTDALDMAKEPAERYVKESASFHPERLSQLIRQFSELLQQMKYAQAPRVLLDVALIKTCNPVLNESYDGLLSRLILVEKKLKDTLKKGVAYVPAEIQVEAAPKEEPIVAAKKIKVVENDAEASEIWNTVKETFSAGTDAIIAQTTARIMDNGTFCVICPSGVYAEYINKKRLPLIAEALAKETGREFTVKAVTADGIQSGKGEKSSTDDEYINLTKQLEAVGLEYTEIN